MMKLDSGNEIVVPDCAEPDGISGNIFARLLVKNTIGAPIILMRKEVFEKVGGFEEDMQCLEDWDFVLKVSKAYEIGFLPGVSWKLRPRRAVCHRTYPDIFRTDYICSESIL